MKQVRMKQQRKCPYSEENIAPGSWIACRYTDVQQDISRHTEVSVQPAIHNKCSQFRCITKYAHTYPKTAGGYCPDDNDIAALPSIHQWKLAKVRPPEEQPQAIIRNHRDDLY